MLDIVAWMGAVAAQYGYIGVLAASFVGNATLFLPLPTYLIVYALAPGMDPWLLGAAAGLGAALGELVGYLVGYGIERGANLSKSRFSKQHEFAKGLLERWGFWAVAVFAATPLPDDLIGIACGAVRYPLAKFFAATLLGKIVMHWAIAWSGVYSFAMIKEIFGGLGETVSFAAFALGIVLVVIAGKVFSWERLTGWVKGAAGKKGKKKGKTRSI